ncbi:DUF6470 family protein [Aciduricibacillus chroicocephali]|uniref:DUF6470 family protein n=1 Tax=Aciduricibacillus chroicocephali TaxID=3054939 RepID=A0ABY9KTF3_9BACI|nr:DUF6470 family protein [Bacillaceae bacterium 44XB]
MQLPQIRMESKLGQISLQTINAKQEIRQPQADLSIEQPHAEITMHTKPGKLTIDQSKAFEEMNLMSILRRNDKFAQEGMQAIQEGIGRRAAEGTELMRIEDGGNPLVSQAVNYANPPMKTLAIKFVPSYGSVKINYEPADLDIQVTPQKPRIDVQINKPEMTYTPGRVEVGMLQKAELNIDFVNLFPGK